MIDLGSCPLQLVTKRSFTQDLNKSTWPTLWAYKLNIWDPEYIETTVTNLLQNKVSTAT